MSAMVDHRAEPTGGDDAAHDGSGEADVVAAVPEPVRDDTHDAGDVPGIPDPRDATGGSQVVQDDPDASRLSLRTDFGAHLEANYQRLVAQLYAITLDSGEAHDAVQDAYSRAWRNWAEIGRSADPTGWIRRVAVRSTQRSWRRMLAWLGVSGPRPVGDSGDPRTVAVLRALGRLPAPERRAVVLYHMVGMSVGEIAALERTSEITVRTRLGRAHQVVTEGMADALPSVLGLSYGSPARDDYSRDDYYGDEERY